MKTWTLYVSRQIVLKEFALSVGYIHELPSPPSFAFLKFTGIELLESLVGLRSISSKLLLPSSLLGLSRHLCVVKTKNSF